MLRTRQGRYRPRRRGMILLVVLTLLTLFALVGISFVLVAGSQETSARIARESETQFKPNVDPEAALAFFLGQFLYDVNNDTHGARSAMRGHSLARGMYGWWDGTNPGQTTQQYVLNDKPFTGTGRLYADQASGYLNSYFNNPGGGAYFPPACSSDSFILNYTYFQNDSFVRDPERLGWRSDPTASFSAPPIGGQPAGVRWFAGGANVPYTYPDHNNFFLAQVDPNDGLILVPSFHREYLFGRLDLPATPPAGVPNPQPQVDYNPNWNDTRAKYLTLRPTPAHHFILDPNNNRIEPFPMPVDRWGDVKNLDGFPGGADSIWIDIGAPVMVAPQSKATKFWPTAPDKPLRYKMLVAPLILELDSRVNLNVVGNWLGINQANTNVRENRSNQGWGMWEINPAKVLDYPNPGSSATDVPQEWLNLFLGSEGSGGARIRGRHDNYPPNPNTDPDRMPRGRTLGGSAAAGSQGPRVWAQVDYDGMENDMGTRKMSTKLGLAKPDPMNDTGGNWVFGLPIFPPKSYLNGSSTENSTDHPALYNIPRPTAPNRNFPVKDMAQLLRFGGSGSDALASDLMRLFPQNLIKGSDNRAGLRRNLITLLSADLDRPGALPYSWKPDASGTGTTGTDPEEQQTRLTMRFDTTNFPAGVLPGMPSLGGSDPNNPIPFPSLNMRPNTPDKSEFDGRTWRSTVAQRGRIDLLRAALYPYPADMTQSADVRKAIASRQALAGEIFETLRRVTGAMASGAAYALPPFAPYKYSREFMAIRYLAQLAVNIVDYIDTDEISTPFCIPETNQKEWVFGFELPRLVINEVHAQYDNDKNSFDGTKVPADATGHYAINTWVELMNPVPEDNVTTGNGTVANDCTAKLVDTFNGNQFPIYRLLLVDAKAGPVLRDPGNALGDPDFDGPAMTRIQGVVGKAAADWGTITSVKPLPAADRFDDGAPTVPNPVGTTQKLGFYVVAPLAGAAGRFDWIDPTVDKPNFPKTDLDTPQMTWILTRAKAAFDDLAEAERPRPMVMLQRLANPRLPENREKEIPDPTDSTGARKIPNPDYNPFITVDYHECYKGQVEYGRRYDTVGNAPTPPPPAMADRASWGRNQPLAAFADSQTIANPTSPRKRQDPMPTPPMMNLPPDQPKHTFERQNSRESVLANYIMEAVDPPPPMPAGAQGTLKKPFDWLVHLDRAPNSVGELLHVSALRPFDVLQYFIVQDTGPNATQQHKAPWLDQTARLYRFLEYVSAVNDPYRFDRRTDPDSTITPAPLAPGFWGRPNSRVQGKINLNMVMSQEILQAMADPQNGNTFTTDDVRNLFNTMLVPTAAGNNEARTPLVNLGGTIGTRAMAGPTDRRLVGAQFSPLWTDVAMHLNKPFWGLSMGYAKNPTVAGGAPDPFLLRGDPPDNVRGLPQSVLRSSAAAPGPANIMFDVPNPPPPMGMDPKLGFPSYQTKELLAKVFNNLTTRSNVFAVWVTVGFFEVIDETETPVKLGAEVGKAENRHVRYRTFAIVDRSQMTAFSASLSVRDAMNNPAKLVPDQYVKQVDTNDPIPGIKFTTLNPPAPGANTVTLNWDQVIPATATEPTKYLVKDSRTGRQWEVTDGTILVIDPRGDNEEAVVVKSYYPNPMTLDRELYANFIRAHGDGAPVICHGNPGPMDRYDPRKDTDVVPYFQLID